MSEIATPPPGLTDVEAARFDDLEKRSTKGLTDAEVTEYEGLGARAHAPSAPPPAAVVAPKRPQFVPSFDMAMLGPGARGPGGNVPMPVSEEARRTNELRGAGYPAWQTPEGRRLARENTDYAEKRAAHPPGFFERTAEGIAGGVMAAPNAAEELVRRQEPGGDLFDASTRRKAGKTLGGSIAAGALKGGAGTALSVLMPGTTAAFSAAGATPGVDKALGLLHKPAEFVKEHGGGELATELTDQGVNLAAMLLAHKGTNRIGTALKESPGGRAFDRGFNTNRLRYSEPIGPTRPTHTIGGIPLDAEGREIETPTNTAGSPGAGSPMRRGPIRLEPSEMASADDIARLRADARAAELAQEEPHSRSDFPRKPTTAMPIEGPNVTGVDDNGLPRFGKRGMRRGGGESGALALPDPERVGAALGNAARRFKIGGGTIEGGSPSSSDVQMPAGAAPKQRELGTLVKSLTATAPDQFGVLYGEPGAKIGRMAKDFFTNYDRGAGNWAREVSVRTKGLTAQDRAQMTQVAEGRMDPQNDAQRAALAWWHEQSDAATGHAKVGRDVNASGSRITENRAPDQLPQVIPDSWRLTQGPKGTVNVTRPIDTTNTSYSPMMASEAARELIKARDPATIAKIAETNVGYGKEFATKPEMLDALKAFDDDRSLKGTNPGTERARRIILPDELREPDWVKAISKYGDNAYRSAAEHHAVEYRVKDGPNAGAPINPDQNGVPQGKLGDALSQIAGDPNESGDAFEAKTKFLSLVGRSQPGTGSKVAQQAASAEGAVNALLSYGMKPVTVARHATQSAFLNAFLSDIDPTIIAKASKDVATSAPRVYDTALRSGAMDPIMRTPETLGETSPAGEGPGLGARMNRGLQTATRVALSPLSAFSGIQRMVAVAAADHVAPRLTAQLQAGGWWERNATAKLEAMEFSPEKIARFKSGDVTPELMDELRQSIVRVTQGNAETRERPAWMNTTPGQVAMRGKQFEAAQMRNTGRIGLDPLLKNKNPIPGLALLGGTAAIGAGVLGLKRALTGPTQTSEDDSVPAGTLADVAEGGFGGPITKIADAVTQVARGNQGRGSLDSQILPSEFARVSELLFNYPVDLAQNAAKRDTDTTKKTVGQITAGMLVNEAPAVREWVRIIHGLSPDEIQAVLAKTPFTEKTKRFRDALKARKEWLESK